jgi:ubiquinone/menaquinone biosynthesis C-methylase UbiE
VEEVQEYWNTRTKGFGDSWASSFWSDPEIGKKVDDFQMRWLRRYVDQIKPCQKVLEVGCGVGRFTVRLANRGAQVYGIDTSPEAIRIMQKKAIPDARFEVMDARSLKFQDETFEWVFSITVLMHITEVQELFRAVKEILRVLRRDGKAILLECTTDMRRERIVLSLPRSEWIKIIERAGGRIESIEKLDYPMTSWEGWYTLFRVIKNKRD